MWGGSPRPSPLLSSSSSNSLVSLGRGRVGEEEEDLNAQLLKVNASPPPHFLQVDSAGTA